MSDFASLLFPLFAYLRKANLSIGVGDYLLALKVLRSGQGLEHIEQMCFTCKVLWAKSQEEQEIIDSAFRRLVSPHLQTSGQQSDVISSSKLSQYAQPDQQNDGSNSSKSSDIDSSTGNDSIRRAWQGKAPLNPNNMSKVGGETPKAQGNYQLTPRLPISKREMTGIWRHLRKMGRSGLQNELDVQGTISAICRDGFLRQPVLRSRRQNQSHLLILIDRHGSMAPFTPLVDALIDSIQRSGLASNTQIYYFHNCPEDYLAIQPGLIQYRPIETVLAPHRGSILIISDAGAAYGAYRRLRVEQTQEFLTTLRRYTHLLAWLNPIPRSRWRASTSGHIAELVPMFPFTRDGQIDTVNILRGHPFTIGS